MPEIPHFDLPLRFEGGKPAYVEQDSVEEMANSVEVVLRYPYGFRPDVPEFGTRDLTFMRTGRANDEVDRAVSEWEPRAHSAVDSEIDPVDDAVERIHVEVSSA